MTQPSETAGEPPPVEPERWLPSGDGLFNLLFDEMPCYGCVLDEGLNIVAVNRRCRESFATPFSRRCYQVFKGREEVCDDCPAATTLAENRVSESEEVVRDRSGMEMHVFCRTVPIPGPGDGVKGVLHLSARLSEGEKLRQTLTSFDSQLGAVSHGIKGVLTAMAGGFYMWDSGLEKGHADRLKKGVDIARRSFQRLQHLAHDVLYYVRDRRFHPEALDGADLLKNTLQDLREDWSFEDTEIVLEGTPPPLPLEADRRALESALKNLVISSLDDCRADRTGGEKRVRLSARAEGGFAVFEVEDNGIGMDEDTLNKVFSLFFNPKGIEAAGVGLYIANKLTRLHKGEVEIRSERGKGTRYRMRIPMQRSASRGGDRED